MSGYVVAGLAAVVCVLAWRVGTLSSELYAQRTVSAVFRAVEQLADDRLGGDTMRAIKSAYVMKAYRNIPPLAKAACSEQGFLDLVERQYEEARRMAIEVMNREEDLHIDLD